MAGIITVLARFMGDSSSMTTAATTAKTGLKGVEDQATRTSTTVGQRMGSMKGVVGKQFGAMGAMVGGEMGNMMMNVANGFQSIGDHAHGMAAKLAGAGAVVGGLGMALQMAATGDVQGNAALKAAIEASGHSFGDYQGQIDSTISKMENLGHTTPEVQSALAVLTSATNSPAKALANMGLVANLAASRHISLASAASLVARVLNGSGNRTLMMYGVTMTKTAVTSKALVAAEKAHQTAISQLANAQTKYTNLLAIDHTKKKLTLADEQKLAAAHDQVKQAQANLQASTAHLGVAQAAATKNMNATQTAANQLAAKLKGQASAAVTGFGGKVSILKAHIADWTAQLGQKLGPALTMLGPALMGVGVILDIVRARQAAQVLSTEAVTVATSEGILASLAARAASMAETAGIIALYAAQYIASGATKAWAAAQWLLNAAMDANPVGLIIVAVIALAAVFVLAYNKVGWFRAFVQATFHVIGTIVSDVVGFIKGHWQLLLAILTGPIGLAILFVKSHWSGIVDIISGVVGLIKTAWGVVVDVLTAPFRAAVNLIKTIMAPVMDIIHAVTGFLGGGSSAKVAGSGRYNGIRPARATGGSVFPGHSYMVGERHAEIFQPTVAGRIIANPGAAAMVGHANGGGVHIHAGAVSVSVSGEGSVSQGTLVAIQSAVHDTLLTLARELEAGTT